MGTVVRLLCLAVSGVVAAATLTVTVQLAATTALIMGGTGHPLVGESPGFAEQYTQGALDLFIAPTGAVRADSSDPATYHRVAVGTPEQFWPVVGADHFDASVAAGADNLVNCLHGRNSCKATHLGADGPASDYVIFGYSQSARIASIVKRDLIAQYRTSIGATPAVSFVVVSNPNRPNGGFLERFAGLHIPVLGVTFDGATPVDSCAADGTNCRFLTADIAQQYDGWADFPRRPLNLLADLNALAGIAYLHEHYTVSAAGAIDQGTVGDTTYYLLPTRRLPLLMPLAQLGVPGPILDVLDAPLRVIVEWAYDRAISPGEPTPATLRNPNNPATMVRDLLAAIPVGLDDGLHEAGLGRPLGTTRAGPFGVGGTTLPMTLPTTLPGGPAPSDPVPGTRRATARPPGAARPKPRTPPARSERPKAGKATAAHAGVGRHRARF
ncbi:PE-PPE domain-containing protein [Mycolicibacterium aichiense]|uniref:PE-PPE domain-containing protein n=1 Tax=Mycolicibacterium aichiense TaxID=1799 RepID=UPI000E02BE9E|nr:PE-PPE domain-containing protein [Mycolicibacterium aichiense]MCV7018077.1 PE-PPE domain-containing protein [Mycolicibacterium aichiense]STZ24459.1 PE-PPE-like protein [Mycolicibacterium aichiense]